MKKTNNRFLQILTAAIAALGLWVIAFLSGGVWCTAEIMEFSDGFLPGILLFPLYAIAFSLLFVDRCAKTGKQTFFITYQILFMLPLAGLLLYPVLMLGMELAQMSDSILPDGILSPVIIIEMLAISPIFSVMNGFAMGFCRMFGMEIYDVPRFFYALYAVIPVSALCALLAGSALYRSRLQTYEHEQLYGDYPGRTANRMRGQ